MTEFRTCPLCEATCGLAIEVSDGVVGRIRGDREDVFSHGFLCPKGVSLKALHEDPDRLRTPLVDGHEATWEEAFAAEEERLGAVLAGGDRDAVAIYVGNPTAHSLSNLVYGRALFKALGTKNVFTASAVDRLPKQVAAGLMFGGGLSVVRGPRGARCTCIPTTRSGSGWPMGSRRRCARLPARSRRRSR